MHRNVSVHRFHATGADLAPTAFGGTAWSVRHTLALWRPYLLSALRTVTGFLFLAHGTQKLFLFPSSPAGLVPLDSQLGVAGLLECVGGALLMMGLFTQPVAFVLAGEMAIAYFSVHAPQGFWPIANGGELAVLYCFIFLYLAATGGGPWSLDTHLRTSFRRRES